jgi:uncharacterized RDD family membrane protein YckC
MDQTVENSNPAANQTPAETPMPVISSVEYSSNTTRLAAYIIDTCILALIGLVISVPLTHLFNSDSSIFSILLPVIGPFYFSYLQSKNGQTVGMKFLGIKVIKEDGSNLTFGGALARYFLFGILDFLTIGIASLWALFNPKKQTLYDIVVKTIYVAQDEKQTRAKWVIGGYCCCGPILFVLGMVALVTFGALSLTALSQVPGLKGAMPKASTPSIPTSNSLEMTKPVQPTPTFQKPASNQMAYDLLDLETASVEIKNQVDACVKGFKADPTVGKYDFTEFCKCGTDYMLNMKKTAQESAQYCATYFPEEVKNLTNMGKTK